MMLAAMTSTVVYMETIDSGTYAVLRHCLMMSPMCSMVTHTHTTTAAAALACTGCMRT